MMGEAFEKYGIPDMIGLSVSFAYYNDNNKQLQLGFTDGSCISISNPFTVAGTGIDELTKCTILATGGNSLSGELIIEFDHGKLIIDVRPESYSGPEAFVFHAADRRYFVG